MRPTRLAFASLLIVGCATTGGESGVTRELANVKSFRASGHIEASLAALDGVLKRVHSQGGPETLSPTERASLETELEGTRAFVREIGAKEAAAGQPLAAEAALARLAPLLAHDEVADAKKAASARAREAGSATCTRMQATVTPDAPHWGLVVSRYCAHFGATFEPPPLTASVGGIDVSGAVVGMTPAQTQALSARLDDWLRASLWYEGGGGAKAKATVQGKIETSFSHQSVTRHAPYRERITTETVGGYNAPPPPGSFARTVQPFLSPGVATSTTEVDRVYAYDAEEHRGHYGITAKVSLDVGGAAPLTFTLQRVENLKAYEHDADFGPAGLQPDHQSVPSADEWLQRQYDRMATRLVLFLNHRFVAANCTTGLEALDAAARCALAGQRPAVAIATLSAAIGEDAQRAMPVLRPPPPPPPPAPRAARKPAPPAPKRPTGPPPVEDAENPVFD